MSGHSYSEDQLVEQPAIQLFAEMGWQTVSALEEAFSVSGWLDHETKVERGWAELLASLYYTHCDLLFPRLQLGAIELASAGTSAIQESA